MSLVGISLCDVVKTRCLELPGHYLYTPEQGRLGCVISIQKGVKGVAYPVVISQKVTKKFTCRLL